jgi:hypothetical protein
VAAVSEAAFLRSMLREVHSQRRTPPPEDANLAALRAMAEELAEQTQAQSEESIIAALKEMNRELIGQVTLLTGRLAQFDAEEMAEVGKDAARDGVVAVQGALIRDIAVALQPLADVPFRIAALEAHEKAEKAEGVELPYVAPPPVAEPPAAPSEPRLHTVTSRDDAGRVRELTRDDGRRVVVHARDEFGRIHQIMVA